MGTTGMRQTERYKNRYTLPKTPICNALPVKPCLQGALQHPKKCNAEGSHFSKGALQI